MSTTILVTPSAGTVAERTPRRHAMDANVAPWLTGTARTAAHSRQATLAWGVAASIVSAAVPLCLVGVVLILVQRGLAIAPERIWEQRQQRHLAEEMMLTNLAALRTAHP